MAMTTCGDRGHAVSDEASTGPMCGVRRQVTFR